METEKKVGKVETYQERMKIVQTVKRRQAAGTHDEM